MNGQCSKPGISRAWINLLVTFIILNDIVVARGEVARVINIEVFVNDELCTYINLMA